VRIIFAGTPELAVPCLKTLAESQHEIVLVLTQPDRPAGRGHKLMASAVKQCALQYPGIPIAQPKSLKPDENYQLLKSYQPDLIVVIAYGLLIPKNILELPPFGCVNAHISLLPRWRGASPGTSAILAGDTETGVTLMQMDVGMDTGAMLAKAKIPIASDDTTESLHKKLGELAAKLVIDNLEALEQKKLTPLIQNDQLATHAKKISKEGALINWSLPAVQIERMVRAFNPWPIAHTIVGEERLRIWQSEILKITTKETPGTIIARDKNGLDIACGEHSVLRITQLQWPGGKILTAPEINNQQQRLLVGYKLGQ
jgi:methionyl-tRNA formyltransferase